MPIFFKNRAYRHGILKQWIRRFEGASAAIYTPCMSDQEHNPSEENAPEKNRKEPPESPSPPPGKGFQIILVQTIVFAAVFFTIIWLVEGQPLIAAALGTAAIVYLLARKFTGKG